MLRAQGKYLSEDEIKNIKRLLATTELSLQGIGARMNCAKTTIAAINRKYGIRAYNGRRSAWMVNLEFLAATSGNTERLTSENLMS
jgi:hypothetical protein